jgi:HNH endonuclease
MPSSTTKLRVARKTRALGGVSKSDQKLVSFRYGKSFSKKGKSIQPLDEIYTLMDESCKCWISNMGKIYRQKRVVSMYRDGAWCTTTIYPKFIVGKKLSTKGYVQVNIGKRVVTLHRLVAKYFLPNLENKPQINHIDGNKLNNCVGNLEWVTNQENRDHAVRHGLHTHGECGYNKLTEQDVLDIRYLSTLGIQQWRISKLYPVQQQAISRIVNRMQWRHI